MPTASGVQRVTNGEGEASNPSWNPDGQHFAFSWTSGYAKGDFNVFVMDFGSRAVRAADSQRGQERESRLGAGRPHLVFASTRTGKSQIYTMLADGTQVKQLTREGDNRPPFGELSNYDHLLSALLRSAELCSRSR